MQDNLAGKVTAFDSAMEGLGIALYSYFSGPLSGAVELATGLLQGITAALTPQKTELETFIGDVAAMNQETASAIQNAQQTVNAGIEKAETITAFGETLQGVLTSCEEYNQITLDDGTTRIVSSTGEVVI
jgi:small nuclear ribonucleoprotein (snRNP)-like protein